MRFQLGPSAKSKVYTSFSSPSQVPDHYTLKRMYYSIAHSLPADRAASTLAKRRFLQPRPDPGYPAPDSTTTSEVSCHLDRRC